MLAVAAAGVRKKQVAVTALETYLLLHAQAATLDSARLFGGAA